jgi:hypothetical protein
LQSKRDKKGSRDPSIWVKIPRSRGFLKGKKIKIKIKKIFLLRAASIFREKSIRKIPRRIRTNKNHINELVKICKFFFLILSKIIAL